MEFSIAWLTRPIIAITNKLISVDKSIIPSVTLVGSSDKNSNRKMKVIKLVFSPKLASILIQEIYSKEKLYSAFSSINVENSPSFYCIGFNFMGNSMSLFEYKDKVIFSEENEEVLFSVFDNNKPIKITIKFSFFKRYTFFV